MKIYKTIVLQSMLSFEVKEISQITEHQQIN